MPSSTDDPLRHNKADRPFLNTAQAAHYLGLSLRTLEQMRSDDEGPPFRRHGQRVFYHISDLESWSRQSGNGRGHA